LELDPIPAKGSLLRFLLICLVMPSFGCGDFHILPPSPPENLQAEFTEDIFGTDGVLLTWEDTDGSDDIGFTVYRDGGELVSREASCIETSEDLSCTPAFPVYFDDEVQRGETYCYAVSSHYSDWLDDAIFGESDKCEEVCITIPLQGFTRSLAGG